MNCVPYHQYKFSRIYKNIIIIMIIIIHTVLYAFAIYSFYLSFFFFFVFIFIFYFFEKGCINSIYISLYIKIQKKKNEKYITNICKNIPSHIRVKSSYIYAYIIWWYNLTQCNTKKAKKKKEKVFNKNGRYMEEDGKFVENQWYIIFFFFCCTYYLHEHIFICWNVLS